MARTVAGVLCLVLIAATVASAQQYGSNNAADQSNVTANVEGFIYIAVTDGPIDFGNTTPFSCENGNDVGDVTVLNPPGNLTAVDLYPFGNIWEMPAAVTVLVVSTKDYDTEVIATANSGTSNLTVSHLAVGPTGGLHQPLRTTNKDLLDTGSLGNTGIAWQAFDLRLTVLRGRVPAQLTRGTAVARDAFDPQALPGSKMGTVASDWRTNPATQITWGLNYISGRYGTPCGAWSAFQAKGWY